MRPPPPPNYEALARLLLGIMLAVAIIGAVIEMAPHRAGLPMVLAIAIVVAWRRAR